MAYSDPITPKQLGYISSLAEGAIAGFESLDDLDDLVKEVYGCRVDEMNRGQASMLIDDLKYELGELDIPPRHRSIFAGRAPS